MSQTERNGSPVTPPPRRRGWFAGLYRVLLVAPVLLLVSALARLAGVMFGTLCTWCLRLHMAARGAYLFILSGD